MPAPNADLRRLIDDLNHTYARLHTAKEEAFWTSYMGLADDADEARAELDRREIELQRFIRDAAKLEQVRDALAGGAGLSDRNRVALEGWERTFASNVIEGAEAQSLSEEIIEMEGRLARARGSMTLGFTDPDAGFTPASSVKLSTMLISDEREPRRKAAWEGLRSIENHVLQHGFLEIVKKRNQLGRALGGEDYYDWKVRRTEGMSKAEIFALLDELEVKTRDTARNAIDDLRRRVGASSVTPWNAKWLTQGDITREQDPYFPFEKSLERWARTFAALAIDYNGALMRLDLLDRKGKYENGFMHGPEIAWREDATYHTARIHFTANAIPGMVGSGHRATNTLFHEGGHAAHFANIDMPAPCFGQEFAPTSVAFAEIQSMFLDSLLEDADWLTRYARTTGGEPMPWELIEKGLHATHPYAAWTARGMLAVCYAEKAIYELPERELTPDRVLNALRDVERRMLFMDEGSHRPVLSVPHLLAGESSAYYHGYVLARMGVQQTREYFLERDGQLTDNPKIGPDLRERYWRPGNSRRCTDLVQSLTGRPLGAAAWAAELNRPLDEVIDEARRSAKRSSATVPATSAMPAKGERLAMNARIEVVHGRETIAAAHDATLPALFERFESWVAGMK